MPRLRPVEPVQHEMAQAGLEEVPESSPVAVRAPQPAVLENFVLGKLLQQHFRLVFERREGGHEKYPEGRPIEADQIIQPHGVGLRRLAQPGPIGPGKN